MKRAGCCTLCDVEVFEVLTRFPDRRPRNLGKPLETAWRANVVLTDSTTCDLTFCGGCIGEVDGRLPEVWRICLDAMAAEAKTEAHLDDLARLAGVRPLGVMASVPWRELVETVNA